MATGEGARAGDATTPAVAQAVELIDDGRFAEAHALIDATQAALPAGSESQRSLEFQRERMRRILLDFSLDGAQTRAAVRRQIPDLRDDEFERWRRAGLLESRVVDGEVRYFNRAPHNLFRLSAEARARRAEPKPFRDSPLERQHPHHAEVRDQAVAQSRRSVAPRRVRVTQSLTVDADTVPAGETIRAWIPYPRAIPGQQEDLRLLSTRPSTHVLAPESAMQRTAYFEQPARAGEPTRFSVSYELTVYGQYVAVDPEKVVPVESTPELAPHLAERAPHVVFTDAMRLFSAQVVGEETNPYRIARKLFDAVDRIPWAGALEYSTITNIGEHALRAGHADCGQQTLLLITLLRLNGIPARWQSGWIFSDAGYDNMHDWGWLYLAPYGWLPMDVTFGRLTGDDPDLAGFYLGGFDAYRIAFNDDYGRDFVPAKTHFRSETVDLQRGEAEWDGGNLYFDQWDYDFEWELLPLPSPSRT
ncbi:transglutaminase-like domain-containing protein [Luteimonas saliphila]|uniref:transglutaminase-like domain-containing protein n=1 Tax=Luteimonas saliphila TaxID=2804919 RepID=UPI001EE1AB64|nr:transglutaminase domain-containing protein [Luteimonas saliphila]